MRFHLKTQRYRYVFASCVHENDEKDQETPIKATFHLMISVRGQHATGKIQRDNYHHGSCGPSLTSKTMSVFLIFTQGTHRNVKNRWVRSSLYLKTKGQRYENGTFWKRIRVNQAFTYSSENDRFRSSPKPSTPKNKTFLRLSRDFRFAGKLAAYLAGPALEFEFECEKW